MGKRRDRRQQQASSRRVKLDLSMDDEAIPPSEIPENASDNPLSLLGQYSGDEADEDSDVGVGSFCEIESEVHDAVKDEDEQVAEKDVGECQATDTTGSEEICTTSSAWGVNSDQQNTKDEITLDMKAQDSGNEHVWQPVLDESSGHYYYWNMQTGETTWVKPVGSEGADKVNDSTNQTSNFEPSSCTTPEYQKQEASDENKYQESNVEGRSPVCQSHGFPSLENAIIYSECTQYASDNTNIGLVSSSCELPGDTVPGEKDVKDSNDVKNSDIYDEVEEKEGNSYEELRLPTVKDDESVIKLEAVDGIQGTYEKNAQQMDAGIVPTNGTSVEGMPSAQVMGTDVEDASGGRETIKDEAQTIIEEKMASLVQMGESLQCRLKALIWNSSAGVSRHSVLASQTEARLKDWKTFCSLKFAPDACLAFIREELVKLESILSTTEEADKSQNIIASISNLQGSHELKSEFDYLGQSVDLAYCQQENDSVLKLCKEVKLKEISVNIDDIEEGEIPAYQTCVSEDPTTVSATVVSTNTGAEEVDMDVDMEVDVEVAEEPAVPGMTSDLSVNDVSVSYSYYSLAGSNDMSIIGPLAPGGVGDATYYHTGVCGDSWAPPLPPDDEWAPPPPGESEPAPPPPPDEPPPLPPQSPVVDAFHVPIMPSEIQIQYYVPEYALENTSIPQVSSAMDYQSITDPSLYGAYVEGVFYSSCSQPTATLGVEQSYVVVSSSTPAFNEWAPSAVASVAALPVKGVMAPISANPVTSKSFTKSVSHVLSTTSNSVSEVVESTIAGATSETKKPIKSKMKKRTHAIAAAPMLNKKVSNLVSKWKQAKEELHGDEDDDEDKALYDLEVLEKKRQKEIEEWRRQQIASGEALDNANFQPLGNLDWRERVKRARKADSKEPKEAAESSTAALSTTVTDNVEAPKSQKPNMTELSKGLPAGWEAYWDETSGEVYYGNLTTRETTWDRPVT
ncbi:hypothetical protein KP509_17G006200 [Ceratopteris richardii]|uniref:WW domain-containing protein n=1 Tax=Ceratopteris richardii TaxID=49495 RepID=A0A8T2SVK9_CERRI|nr:hypothetical protein KP509_17G006200 [Ceratopteris richardii]